ncbi:MAG: hypothetical protein KatS3mg129_0281 [Leptospiraceae bacterium]|nr:MAG: hypothetical protein KatS3mg129_0281 [Leptospiraceae bacterium]
MSLNLTLQSRIKSIYIINEALFLIILTFYLYFNIYFSFYFSELPSQKVIINYFLAIFFIHILISWIVWKFYLKHKISLIEKIHNFNELSEENKINLLKSFHFFIHFNPYFFILSFIRFLFILILDLTLNVLLLKNQLYFFPYSICLLLFFSGIYFIIQQTLTGKIIDHIISITKFFGLSPEIIRYPKLRIRLFLQLFINMNLITGLLGTIGYYFSLDYTIKHTYKSYYNTLNIMIESYHLNTSDEILKQLINVSSLKDKILLKENQRILYNPFMNVNVDSHFLFQ